MKKTAENIARQINAEPRTGHSHGRQTLGSGAFASYFSPSKFLLIMISFIWSEGPVMAELNENNLRNLCRQRVAWIFLKHHDNAEMSNRRLEKMKYETTRIDRRISEHREKVEDLDIKIKKDPLNYEYTEQRDYEKMRMDQLAVFRKRNIEQLAEVEKTAKKENETLKSFKKKLDPVYRVKRHGKMFSKGYPFEIVYKRQCKEFHYSCPLKEDEKKALRKLLENYPMPEVCERYLGQN